MMKRPFFSMLLLVGLTLQLSAQEQGQLFNEPSNQTMSFGTEKVTLEQRVQRFKNALNQLKDCALRKKKCTKQEIVGIVAVLITLYLAIVGIFAIGLKTGVIKERDN